MTMFFNYLPMCSSPISSGSVLHYYLPRCSLQHPPPKKNLTGVLKTTPWIYFAKWDKAGCDKKNNLLVCTALMSSFCFSFCAKYLMFNDGFLRKISAHCQAGVSSMQVFIWPLWLWRGTSAHQRDIIGLTMVIPWALKRPILSILKCLGVCNRLVRLNCHKKIYCDNEFTYYIHLKTCLVIYSRKFSSAHGIGTLNPMISSWWWLDLYLPI